MKHPLVFSVEVRQIALGIGHELLRIAHLAWLLPAKRTSTRVIGSSLASATGAAIKVVGKDPQVKGRYVVQREDGALFTLAKATIMRRRT